MLVIVGTIYCFFIMVGVSWKGGLTNNSFAIYDINSSLLGSRATSGEVINGSGRVGFYVVSDFTDARQVVVERETLHWR